MGKIISIVYCFIIKGGLNLVYGRNLGISTASLYPMYTEEAFEILLKKGIRLFEIFTNSPCEIEDEFIDKINSIRKSHGCKIKSLHPFTSGIDPFMLFSNYYRRFEDMLKYYEKFFKAANRLEAEIVVLHGDKCNKANAIKEEEYFERFFKLANLAKKYDVVLAQENVNLFRSQNIDFIDRMKKNLGDEVKFVLDIKQAIRANEDPFELCKVMGKNLVHLHLNDHDDKNDCLLPCKGTMDYKKLFEILDSIDYEGSIIIEVYRNSFSNVDELIDSYDKFKELYIKK